MNGTTMEKSSNSEEEADYMSEEFLTQCVPKDIRPSLLYKKAEKRKHELQKKQDKADASNKERWKPIRVQEQEAREAGLKKQIGSENKGYQLLAKMGYKPGTAIGRNVHNEGQALQEPIPVEVKGDRMGLGKKTMEKAKLLEFRSKRADQDKLADPTEFRKRIQAAAALKDIEWDLRKAQSACRTLDEGKEIRAPVEPWYWPKVPKLKKVDHDVEERCTEDCKEKPTKAARLDEESSDDDNDEWIHPPQEQLSHVIAYLKKSYFYCIWCGTSYDNDQELIQSCPGNSREDH